LKGTAKAAVRGDSLVTIFTTDKGTR